MLPAHKIVLLGSLYLAQGLPYGFFTQALPVMLRKQGFSLGSIGLTSLLALPWVLKFLWAPLVDRHYWPRLGRRRSWIMPMQAATVALLAAIAALPPAQTQLLLAAAFATNLFAATQDIATDGLAVDILSPGQRGLGNGVQVAGYRVGMIIGGGLLLAVLAEIGWHGAFLSMAATLAVASVPIAVYPERALALAVGGPTPPKSAPSEAPRWRAALTSFFHRQGAKSAFLIVLVFKAGENFASGMLRPLLVDLGIGLADIGLVVGTAGFIAGLLGALFGGALVNRLGRKPALIVFSVLQALAVASVALLPGATLVGPKSAALLYAVIIAEHLASGMATAALFTCMMDWCRKDLASTDYTLQASAVVLASGLFAMLSGFSSQALGYQAHYLLAAALCAAATVVVARVVPQDLATSSSSLALKRYIRPRDSATTTRRAVFLARLPFERCRIGSAKVG
jgi:PAT family beta-lactamase induction signal transducer AmpG